MNLRGKILCVKEQKFRRYGTVLVNIGNFTNFQSFKPCFIVVGNRLFFCLQGIVGINAQKNVGTWQIVKQRWQAVVIKNGSQFSMPRYFFPSEMLSYNSSLSPSAPKASRYLERNVLMVFLSSTTSLALSNCKTSNPPYCAAFPLQTISAVRFRHQTNQYAAAVRLRWEKCR